MGAGLIAPSGPRLPSRTAWAATTTFPVPVAMRPYGRAGGRTRQGSKGSPLRRENRAAPPNPLAQQRVLLLTVAFCARAMAEERRSAFKLGTDSATVRPTSSVIVRSQPPGSGTPLLLELRPGCATSRGRPAFPRAASGLRLSRERSETARAQRGDATTLWNIPWILGELGVGAGAGEFDGRRCDAVNGLERDHAVLGVDDDRLADPEFLPEDLL